MLDQARKYGLFLPLLLIACLILSLQALAQDAARKDIWTTQTEEGSQQVNVYFFWSPTCPHCQDAAPFMRKLPQKYPWIILHSHNVVDDYHGAQLFRQMAAMQGEEARSVPSIFVCGQMIVGWDSPEGVGKQVVELANSCRQPQQPEVKNEVDKTGTQIQAPLIGTVNADDYSLPVFTLIIAGLDAFNPCAFFVLLFLLSLLVHARSRTRMLVIGGTFVLISGLVYFVFMAAWLNFFLIIGNVGWITLVAGIVAVIIGIFGIKDYLLAFRGPSLSISDDDKSKLFGRVRGLLTIDSMPALLTGTIMLALAANTYELLCTAGFPMVYTRTLTLHGLQPSTYYLYLVLYNVIYVIPLLVIVGLFTWTLGARKLTVKQGRLLKMLSGLMMLELGVVLLLQPGLLNNITTGLVLLVTAIVITLLAKWFMREKAL